MVYFVCPRQPNPSVSSTSMKVKIVENCQNNGGLKGCKQSSVNAPLSPINIWAKSDSPFIFGVISQFMFGWLLSSRAKKSLRRRHSGGAAPEFSFLFPPGAFFPFHLFFTAAPFRLLSKTPNEDGTNKGSIRPNGKAMTLRQFQAVANQRDLKTKSLANCAQSREKAQSQVA